MRRFQASTPSQEHETEDQTAETGGWLEGMGSLLGLGGLLGNAGLLERMRGEGPRVQDADPEQLDPVVQAVTGARRMAADGLAVLAAGPASPRQAELLEAHFHSTGVTELAAARSTLTAAAAGLGGSLAIEVESSQPLQDRLPGQGQTRAYVYRNLLLGEGMGAIHLCPAFFGLGADEQASTMLHEATHRFAGTRDHAYAGTAAYAALPAEAALENADTYATFCALEAADRAVEEALQQGLAAEAAARDHADAIWAAYQQGAIRLWEDGFTTPEGLVLDPELVARTLNEHFRVHFPERCGEALGHVGEAVSWPDGMRLDAAFTRGMDPDPAEGWCS